MDFEGIAWIGNVYERFETMCLEMEEATYQDTVKYVENQVQTVGTSVKKFYSVAVQDLASPSAKTQEQLADKTFSVYPYGDFGVNNKPKEIFKKGDAKTDEQITEDSEVIPGAKQDRDSTHSGFQKIDHHLQLTEGLELCLEQNEDNGLYGFSSGDIKKTLTNSNIPSETSSSITNQADNLSKLSSCCSPRDNYGLTFEQNAASSCPTSPTVTVCGSGREEISCSNTPTSEPNLPVQSSLKKQARSRCTSSSDACEKSGIVSPTELQISENPEHSGATGHDCLFPPGDDSLDIIENLRIITEPDAEATEQFDKLKVDQNCVMVNRDFFLVHDMGHKSRSYKKKIKKAFSSKRSAIQKEYEQLVVQHGNIDAGSNKERAGVYLLSPAKNTSTKKSPTHYVNETDWELL